VTVRAAGIAIALVFAAPNALADEPPPRVELKHDVRVDGAVTAAMIGGLVSWTVVRDDVIPDTCRICDGPGRSVNALDGWFRDALKRPDVEPARLISNVLSYGVGPIAITTLAAIAAIDHKAYRDLPIDLLLLLEGTMASLMVSESVKPLTLRERPDFHAMSDEERALVPKKEEPYLSFPSGHGGTVLGMTAAAGTIALQRGYRLAPLIWISGIMLSIATSYMRIAADRHYFTDVLGGWAIGGLVGGGVPWLFHGRVGGQNVAGTRLVTVTWTY